MVGKTLYAGARSIKLENGLRILAEEVPQSRSVSVGVWINVGSRDDPDHAAGLAHFLEHLMFKGTTTRNALRVSQEIDSVGGFLDAATGKESTFFYADVPDDGLAKATDLLLDLVFHPAFAPDKIDLERNVVLEEIRGYDDDPEQRAFDQFVEGLWADHHPLSRAVLGTRASMESATRDDVVDFHRTFYQPSNMVIAAAGAIDIDAFFADIERRVPRTSTEVSPRAGRRTPPAFQTLRAHHVQPTGQTHIYLGLPGPVSSDPNRYPLELANAVLGDGTSSRMFIAIREERGLAYAVQSAVSRFSDAGFWLSYAAVAPDTADAVVALLVGELDRLRSEPVPEEELALAKSRLRGSLILGLESNAHRAMRLGNAALSEREILSPDAILAKLAAVDADDVSAAVERYNQPGNVNLVTVGPTPS
ncbi:MAG: pitrilysin family protein [Candidatus Bipolaricaulota bacterium]|nr:pitrilysin family protein [Candidatus Bipolaricaulota bacterium]